VVWHYYVVAGEITADPLRAKFLHLRGLVTGQYGEFIVAVSSVYKGLPNEVRPALAEFIAIPVTSIFTISQK
jgi:hypothetical protein